MASWVTLDPVSGLDAWPLVQLFFGGFTRIGIETAYVFSSTIGIIGRVETTYLEEVLVLDMLISMTIIWKSIKFGFDNYYNSSLVETL